MPMRLFREPGQKRGESKPVANAGPEDAFVPVGARGNSTVGAGPHAIMGAAIKWLWKFLQGPSELRPNAEQIRGHHVGRRVGTQSVTKHHTLACCCAVDKATLYLGN